MTAILILAGVIAATGAAAYLLSKRPGRPGNSEGPEAPEVSENSGYSENSDAKDSECCGLHAVCEKMSSASASVEYFDDEELDTMAGTAAGAYTPAQVAQFREVLDTLPEGEAPDWLRSLRQRGIALPDQLRDEAIMLVEEAASAPAGTQAGNKQPRQ